MPNVAEVLRRALAKKRADELRKQLEDDENPTESASCIKVKYVKCRTCDGYQSWDAFIVMHGANPRFCQCKPGDEDLVTFHLSIRRADVDDEVKGV